MQSTPTHKPNLTIASPDTLTAIALTKILNPNSLELPAEILVEMARRNDALTGTDAMDEIRKTLARQVILLEALATRQIDRAARLPPEKAKTANLFIGQALAAQKALTLTMSAIYQMEKDRMAAQKALSLPLAVASNEVETEATIEFPQIEDAEILGS